MSDMDKAVRTAISGCWSQIKVTAGSIAEASIASATASVKQLISRIHMTSLFHVCGERATSLLSLDSNARPKALQAFMQGVYTKTLDTAREAGKDEHKRQVASGQVPVLTQTEMGKSARKGVANKRTDMENFLQCVLSPEHRANAIAMATPYSDPPNPADPTYAERSEVWEAPKREDILASTLVVNVGTEAPYTETSNLHYITQELTDLPRSKRGKFTYATLSYGSGADTEEVEVRLQQMPLPEMFLRLEADAAKSARYVTRCKASVRGIKADHTPDECRIVYQASA